jgi:hypothetical protein
MEFRRTSEEEKQGWVNGIDDILNCFHNWTLDKEKQICVKLTQIKFEAISPLSQPEKKLKNSGS